MGSTDGKNSGRVEDGGRRNIEGSKEEEISSIPDGTGFSGAADQEIATEEGEGGSRGAGGADIDQFVDAPSREIPPTIPSELDELLVRLGKVAGEAGYIFVGGLVPYRRAEKGNAPWEIDVEKDPIRVTNIEESQNVRVSMALMAYLMESMQGDLAKELGVGSVPGTEGQVPS